MNEISFIDLQGFVELIFSDKLAKAHFILFLFSLFVGIAIIVTSKSKWISLRTSEDLKAVQSAHTYVVARVGGVGIFLSILVCYPISALFKLRIEEYLLIIFTVVPIFTIGLSEDLGLRMSPARRLAACIVSGTLVILFFDVWVSKVGIPGFDVILSITPFAIVFTLFATTGVCNAFNLVDGINGFASYVSISIALSLSIAAYQVNVPELSIFLALLISAIFGFFILNFPFGKLFLGDSGAYTLGHILVWLAVILTNFDDTISPFAILLIFFWPIADTGLAIYRRWQLGAPADKPDRLHFHQLVMRFLEIWFLGRAKRSVSNPLAALILVPLVSMPQILGIMYLRNLPITIFLTIIMSGLFVTTYLFGIKLARSKLISSYRKLQQ